MQKLIPAFVWAAPILLGAYVLSYFEIVRLQRGSVTAHHGRFEPRPDYHGLPSAIFIPIHEVDRRLLRPGMWSRPANGFDVMLPWREP